MIDPLADVVMGPRVDGVDEGLDLRLFVAGELVVARLTLMAGGGCPHALRGAPGSGQRS